MPVKERAWSISALKAFETCPKRYKLVQVDKRFKEKQGGAVAEGKEIHAEIEAYIKSGKPFPIGRSYLKPLVDKVLPADRSKIEIMTETQLALNADLQQVAWFADDVWVRSIVDYGVISGSNALIVDWKTGKRKPDDDQLALMAATIMAVREDIQRVTAAFVWTGSGEIDRNVYTRGEMLDIWNRFDRRVKEFQRAFREEEFPAQPGGLCKRFCPVTTCAYHGS